MYLIVASGDIHKSIAFFLNFYEHILGERTLNFTGLPRSINQILGKQYLIFSSPAIFIITILLASSI